MNAELEDFNKQLFKAAQKPCEWLSFAESLRDAAEAILTHEFPTELPYRQAVAVASEEVDADGGMAEIKAIPPNYPPAQLLYAYAIENVLKGLMVSKQPDRIQESELDKKIITHDLISLAKEAEFTVDVQERPVMQALSQLSTWMGRYPVPRARTAPEFVGMRNAHELLDYGSAHPIMRAIFDRAMTTLSPGAAPTAPALEPQS